MELTRKGISNKAAWEAAGYRLPAFDIEAVARNTKERPVWIHFGAGNIFRAFQANVVQNLLNEGVMDTGLIAAEGYDYELIEKMYHPHDNLSILVTLKADGTIEKTVVGSIVESLVLDSGNAAAYTRLKEIFSAPSLQMASFTITEKGYALTNARGEVLPDIRADYEAGPAAPVSYLGKVISLLYTRYQAEKLPIAMVSMDNCSHNGDKLYVAVDTFARKWAKSGLVDSGFVDYVNSSSVSFPWTMIDKITPRPDPKIQDMLKADAIDGLDPIVTTKNTYAAPFVNAEECEYLVIEDHFPNGRPALEKGGFIFTERETVDKVERMKVTTCLNPLHTALAIFGCLLDYRLISREMENPSLKRLAERIGYDEGLPVVTNPGILDPKEFLREVLEVRIPNPFMPDTPQRIVTDTSQKLSIRYGETIKSYLASDTLDVSSLKLIPLVFAGWLRYLMAIDDNGQPFSLSPDPLLDTVCPYVKDISLGGNNDLSVLDPLLRNAQIFGVDLFEAGLADMVKDYFAKLTAGTKAVEKTLKEAVA
ncbi:MAG TPA: mannitol dehydrogenase family protein [Candidatus Caccomorpha excrementavium]|nr:mannitol dehydrogenase family protein [Candidatus Caccomorpha excrementavium]